MNDHNQPSDKVDLHYRQQLSALMDGALAPDEARFLLRRLQHDSELSECWERWQLAGEAMRGRAVAMLPAGFAARVAEGIAEAPVASKPQAQPRTHWGRWSGGVALAASVAVVALLATRQNAPEQPAAIIAAATPAPKIESPVEPISSPVPVTVQQSNVKPTAARVAATDPPRRSSQRVRTTQRARVEARAPVPTSGESATEAVLAATAAAQTPRPFDASTPPSSRPWPRAVLPQFSTSGALTAGTEADSSPSFYPFEPRLPEDATEPDAGPAQPR
jgi:negative regulator of sigma E activity